LSFSRQANPSAAAETPAWQEIQLAATDYRQSLRAVE
jgi:hypothetical protein